MPWSVRKNEEFSEPVPGMIEFIEIADALEFRDAVWPVLGLEVMPNNMLLGMVDSRGPGETWLPDDRFAILREGGTVVGAVAQTALGRAIFSRMRPDVARCALKRWSEAGGLPHSCFGPEDTIRPLIEVMQGETPDWPPVEKSMMGYELTRVVMPSGNAEGKMRFAASDDENLLVDWGVRFARECDLPEAYLPALEEMVRERTRRALADRARVIWEVDGKPVCMAGIVRPARFGTSVGSVYTPPEMRGRGYASHLVAELSQLLLDRGAPRCLLFTDTRNPVSNAIYQRIGYRHTCDFLLLRREKVKSP